MKIVLLDGRMLGYPLTDQTVLYRGEKIVVPAGYEYNGASIPWVFWTMTRLTPFHPVVRRASLFHDFLYDQGRKEFADHLFRSLMKDDGATRFQYVMCYAAVRQFGGSHVNNN